MTPTSSKGAWCTLRNAEAVALTAVPAVPVAELVVQTADLLAAGGRLAAWFGMPTGEAGEAGKTVELVAVIARDASHDLQVARSLPFSKSYPALTPRAPQAHLFEREVWEQVHAEPLGHPWLKPVRQVADSTGTNVPFFAVTGGEVHEVAVGPVHAGIIEPGHFRFQCEGETVRHLEIALGYQHRGVERALLGVPQRRSWAVVETLAGDTSIGHGTAYAGVLEALAGLEIPLAAQQLRAYALELERLANHTGDLGALAGDVAFQPTAAACGKTRGDFLNLTALLTGNRFGRSWLQLGGVRLGLEAERLRESVERLAAAIYEVETAARWLWESGSVRARFDFCGVVKPELAKSLGLVGPAARASDQPGDVRADHPWGAYRQLPMVAQVDPHGDVAARASVRRREIRETAEWLGRLLRQLDAGPHSMPAQPLRPEHLAVALVEGWRGQLCHVALTDVLGGLRHYKVVDPSFHNWTGLAMALRNQAISDFPLCNKSFNLSYCGHDL